MLLIVMETIPPPFQVDERAKEVPALQVLGDPLEGLGLVPPLEEDELEELEEDEEVDECELDEEDALEAELEADPALQLPCVAHSQVAASEQEGEPPPPQGTWR